MVIEGRLKDNGLKEIWLAGGCFWGTEDYLKRIKGVVHTSVGYANGIIEEPTYELVYTGRTGFVEAVYVVYDPAVISLDFLLDVYYGSINPTSLNKQGGDVGTQYRTGIYYVDDVDKPIIMKSIKGLQTKYDKPIMIEVEPLNNYYLAEAYHQNYLDKNPNGYCHISVEQMEYAQNASMYPVKDKKELKEVLSPLSYEVTQNHATEAPYSNAYDNTFDKGIYVDITTGEPLFSSIDKYDSGCGWPAFSKPIREVFVNFKDDSSHGVHRIEVSSKNSGSHLGHVFNDGIKELGGLRYCINSASLEFIPYEEMKSKGYGYLLPMFGDNHE